MCLSLSIPMPKEWEPKPKINRRDRKVYKLLRSIGKNYESPIKLMKYKKGMHYTEKTLKISWTVDSFNESIDIQVEDGLHAYTSKEKADIIKYHYYGGESDVVVVEMVIPKGAKYFEDEENEEIVTTDLIFY